MDLRELVAAVRAASGITNFGVEFGQLIQEKYNQRMRELIDSLLRSLPKQHPQGENANASRPLWLNPLLPFGPFGLPSSGQE
jgi:hypothetical protein